jgi:hypothetical protein
VIFGNRWFVAHHRFVEYRWKSHTADLPHTAYLSTNFGIKGCAEQPICHSSRLSYIYIHDKLAVHPYDALSHMYGSTENTFHNHLCHIMSHIIGMSRQGYLVYLSSNLIVYSRMSNFSAIWQLSSLALWLALMAFSSEGSLTWNTCCDTEPWFIRSHPKNWYPCPTVEFEPLS